VLRRPILCVLALAVGDHLLWTWSLSHAPPALAAASGLALPVLVVALLWACIVSLLRLVAARVPHRPGVERMRSIPPRGSIRLLPPVRDLSESSPGRLPRDHHGQDTPTVHSDKLAA